MFELHAFLIEHHACIEQLRFANLLRFSLRDRLSGDAIEHIHAILNFFDFLDCFFDLIGLRCIGKCLANNLSASSPILVKDGINRDFGKLGSMLGGEICCGGRDSGFEDASHAFFILFEKSFACFAKAFDRARGFFALEVGTTSFGNFFSE